MEVDDVIENDEVIENAKLVPVVAVPSKAKLAEFARMFQSAESEVRSESGRRGFLCCELQKLAEACSEVIYPPDKQPDTRVDNYQRTVSAKKYMALLSHVHGEKNVKWKEKRKIVYCFELAMDYFRSKCSILHITIATILTAWYESSPPPIGEMPYSVRSNVTSDGFRSLACPINRQIQRFSAVVSEAMPDTDLEQMMNFFEFNLTFPNGIDIGAPTAKLTAPTGTSNSEAADNHNSNDHSMDFSGTVGESDTVQVEGHTGLAQFSTASDFRALFSNVRSRFGSLALEEAGASAGPRSSKRTRIGED
ncbi:hypothetical protein HDU76_006028 [Blyttiomyces sp. JEL0837]|nr:hypothetical protein HDU76_006028 [Blyttiomyces sp. JEL0837]